MSHFLSVKFITESGDKVIQRLMLWAFKTFTREKQFTPALTQNHSFFKLTVYSPTALHACRVLVLQSICSLDINVYAGYVYHGLTLIKT